MMGVEFTLEPLLVTIAIGTVTFILLYKYSTRNHDYWKKKGVPYVKPLPFMGSAWDLLKQTLFEVEIQRYRKYGALYGHFEASNALLSVADPVLLRDIFVKDFHNFTGRRNFVGNDPVVDNMLQGVRGEHWKRLRSIVTPTFSTGKIKRMIGIFNECANTLAKNFRSDAQQGSPVDVKKFYSAFAMDVIASAAFSTKIDSHNDPDNQFVQVARKAFMGELGFQFIIFVMAPWAIKLFKMKLFAPEGTAFFSKVTHQIIEERKKTGQVRNDFLQLLMDTTKDNAEGKKPDSSHKDDEKDITSNYGGDDPAYQIYKTTTAKNLSMDELVAQCVIFFLAGYDTTGSTLSFASYFLALNPDCQEKLREEVDQAITESKGKLTYEALQSMKYLDNVISETLRLYPPSVRAERLADADYKLGDTGITVEKGTIISIPICALHRDPAYFPDPDKFDPNRFNPEERAKRDPYVYLPFGAGPRNCVGMRFALIEMKVCLAVVIAHFRIKRRPETQVPPEISFSSIGLIQPKNIVLDFDIRDDSPLVN